MTTEHDDEQLRFAPEALAERMKQDIMRDIRRGDVPVNVATFARLHDYVDANGYGGLFEAKFLEDEDWAQKGPWMENINAAQEIVNGWLAQGGVYEALAPSEPPSPTALVPMDILLRRAAGPSPQEVADATGLTILFDEDAAREGGATWWGTRLSAMVAKELYGAAEGRVPATYTPSRFARGSAAAGEASGVAGEGVPQILREHVDRLEGFWAAAGEGEAAAVACTEFLRGLGYENAFTLSSGGGFWHALAGAEVDGQAYVIWTGIFACGVNPAPGLTEADLAGAFDLAVAFGEDKAGAFHFYTRDAKWRWLASDATQQSVSDANQAVRIVLAAQLDYAAEEHVHEDGAPAVVDIRLTRAAMAHLDRLAMLLSQDTGLGVSSVGIALDPRGPAPSFGGERIPPPCFRGAGSHAYTGTGAGDPRDPLAGVGEADEGAQLFLSLDPHGDVWMSIVAHPYKGKEPGLLASEDIRFSEVSRIFEAAVDAQLPVAFSEDALERARDYDLFDSYDGHEPTYAVYDALVGSKTSFESVEAGALHVLVASGLVRPATKSAPAPG